MWSGVRGCGVRKQFRMVAGMFVNINVPLKKKQKIKKLIDD